MKIWTGYGTEHSMNLVMIGHFKEAEDAAAALDVIQRIQEQVTVDEAAGRLEFGTPLDNYTDGMMELLRDVGFFSIGADELEQFMYDVSFDHEGDKIVIHTDESEVSAVMKLMITRGARVEVYSAHDYIDTEHGLVIRQQGDN